MNFSMILSVLMVFLFFIFFYTKLHYLSALLILEACMLIALLLCMCVVFNSFGTSSLFLTIMTLGVCEAALGLTVLLSYIKVKGNDYIQNKMMIS
uniref:NADH dehydrogenase subunit 4L n=1 Tax=Solitariphaedusa miyoshii TaxID=1885766 RepID=A0A224ABL6_9EUPU|nr:NADH dehydrogenase subunit 4L [Solitariphaedusa miyoshii]BBA10505.1 NADH dehydrogenase subunit 4L [Solitariphaedusa miyoshii]BBA10751.1 NADH dehydrogenase subunit 4L [Solitariphaedusa miyoshii]